MGVPDGVAELLPGLLVGCQKKNKRKLCYYFPFFEIIAALTSKMFRANTVVFSVVKKKTQNFR